MRLAASEGAIGAQLGRSAIRQRLADLSAALPVPSAGLEKTLEAHDQRVALVLQTSRWRPTAASSCCTRTSARTIWWGRHVFAAVTGGNRGAHVAGWSRHERRGGAAGSAGQHGGAVNDALGDDEARRLATSIAKVESLHADWEDTLKAKAVIADLHKIHEQFQQSSFDAEFVATTDRVVAGLYEASRLTLSKLDKLLVVRIDGLEQRRAIVTVALLVSGLVVTYLFLCFHKVLHGGIGAVTRHIQAMRDGDLTTSPRSWGADEVASLMGALSEMQASLRSIVGEVRYGSEQIVSASTQIAGGAQDLSARTEESAANLEETASAMEQIAATVRRGEDLVREATSLASTNAQAAERGGRVVGELVQTMQSINASSVRIGHIIGTIDGIAFQTNILALNAAVEAARAGEQGRGFAVVAGEVRALAQRSAQAAREVKALVGNSLSQTESGVRVVHDAGGAIQEIVSSATRVNQLLAEVLNGAREQTAGVTQSAQAVQTLDGATQQNAALVEETAAAAGSLKDQAVRLTERVSRFRLPVGNA